MQIMSIYTPVSKCNEAVFKTHFDFSRTPYNFGGTSTQVWESLGWGPAALTQLADEVIGIRMWVTPP